MKDKSLSARLIYLDIEFVSRLYESEFTISPETRITRTQGLHASASIPLFSGGGNSSESRTYGISTLEMLDKLTERINQYPTFASTAYKIGSPSVYCWIDGTLGVDSIKATKITYTSTLIGKPAAKKNRPVRKVVGEEAYFSLKSADAKFALSPTDQYFVSGIAAFKGLTHVVVNRLALPCRALVRVFSANTTFDQWVATPLVIYDAK